MRVELDFVQWLWPDAEDPDEKASRHTGVSRYAGRDVTVTYYYLIGSPAPSFTLVEHYDFQVSILRVNKNINKDATPILYGENKLVKVHNFYGSLLDGWMANHETPFFKLRAKATTFSKHVAEISIKKNVCNPCCTNCM
jgi:hypothetical protein